MRTLLFWPFTGWGLPCQNRLRFRGELLPHHFTLTEARRPAAVYFLWYFPYPFGRWVLPTTLPCGARTFLPPTSEERSPSHLPWVTYRGKGEACKGGSHLGPYVFIPAKRPLTSPEDSLP